MSPQSSELSLAHLASHYGKTEGTLQGSHDLQPVFHACLSVAVRVRDLVPVTIRYNIS